MGREVRRVPADWEHPKGRLPWGEDFKPLYDRSYKEEAADWKRQFAAWEAGENPDRAEHPDMEFWEWHGMPPDPESYRPDWPEESRTHYQFYETVSEGTPLSPPMPSLQSLAEWLAEHGDYWYQKTPGRHSKRTVEQWMRFFDSGGWAPSFVVSDPDGIQDGVDFVADNMK